MQVRPARSLTAIGGEESEWDVDSDGTDWDNEILYCGYRYDPETGLYHVRHRPYDPLTGRWLTRDPIGYADGMSLYAYLASNPQGGPTLTALCRAPSNRFWMNATRRNSSGTHGKGTCDATHKTWQRSPRTDHGSGSSGCRLVFGRMCTKLALGD